MKKQCTLFVSKSDCTRVVLYLVMHDLQQQQEPKLQKSKDDKTPNKWLPPSLSFVTNLTWCDFRGLIPLIKDVYHFLSLSLLDKVGNTPASTRSLFSLVINHSSRTAGGQTKSISAKGTFEGTFMSQGVFHILTKEHSPVKDIPRLKKDQAMSWGWRRWR